MKAPSPTTNGALDVHVRNCTQHAMLPGRWKYFHCDASVFSGRNDSSLEREDLANFLVRQVVAVVAGDVCGKLQWHVAVSFGKARLRWNVIIVLKITVHECVAAQIANGDASSILEISVGSECGHEELQDI